MSPPRLDDWLRWHRTGYTHLPAVREGACASLPENWQTHPAFAASRTAVLLESGLAGRFSFLCDRPERIIVGRAEGAEVRSADGGTVLETRHGAPLSVLRGLLTERRVPPPPADWPPMCGGLFVLLGYDLVHTWEKLPRVADRDLDVPLYAAIEPRELFIYDHASRRLSVVAWRAIAADATESSLAALYNRTLVELDAAASRWSAVSSVAGDEAVPPPPPPATALAPAPSFRREAFCAAVDQVKAYIAAGDTYQVNLSLRTSRETSLPPAAIYDELRRINPSPYMGLWQLPEFSLVCGSPELLVRLADGALSSRPIAGTRRRGAGLPDDAAMSDELQASPKERAEHLMLVDLIRNDLGRVAAFGSVQVPEFMAVERYSHVMHLVSQVEARLAAGQTWSDALRSMFPGGTITGCPKIRTMEIIEELEPVGRGFYTGALGWISYAGDLELNIIIRSMLVQAGVAHVQAGAGIVADSVPDRELDESLRKAQALWAALDAAELRARAP